MIPCYFIDFYFKCIFAYSNLTYSSPAFAPYRTLTIRKNRTMKKEIAIYDWRVIKGVANVKNVIFVIPVL